jgi:CheY-like chemotaxis protein
MKERQLTVLIADDAPDSRASMRDALSRDPAAHYVMIEAESGDRALELWRAMRSRARRPLQMGLQHGRAPVRGNLFKVDLLATSVT